MEAFNLCQIQVLYCDGIMFSDCLTVWNPSGSIFLKHQKKPQTLKLIHNFSVLVKEHLFFSAHNYFLVFNVQKMWVSKNYSNIMYTWIAQYLNSQGQKQFR